MISALIAHIINLLKHKRRAPNDGKRKADGRESKVLVSPAEHIGQGAAADVR